MRVLDEATSVNRNMGKKKHKLRKPSRENIDQSDTSDEGRTVTGNPGKQCTHLGKAINYAAMRKSFIKQKFSECSTCAKSGPRSKKGDNHSSLFAETSGTATDDNNIDEGEVNIWLCLQCGHQGCGRYTTNKHALRHYGTPHSLSHAVAVNLTTFVIWCYLCNDEIIADKSKRIRECVEFIKRQDGEAVDDCAKDADAVSGMMSSSGGASENNSKICGQASKMICPKVKGLNNLGNTCFFNAIIQNLSKTPYLDTLMTERTKKGHLMHLPGRDAISDIDSDDSAKEHVFTDTLVGVDVTLPEAGPLTTALLSFLRDMNTRNNAATVNPNCLFGQVCKKAPRFKGFQQQDSHELLRYLLDNMKTEEIKRIQSAILKLFKLPANVNPKKVESDVKAKIKEYGKQGKMTLIDNLFGGILLSTIICDECHQLSTVFEPFLDLSLSVTEEKPARPVTLGKKLSNESPQQPTEKQSKQQQRKLKKIARREERKILVKNSVGPRESGDIEEKGCQDENVEESEREDTTDADVEDNLESDASRMLAPTPESDGAQAHRDVTTPSDNNVPLADGNEQNGLVECNSTHSMGATANDTSVLGGTNGGSDCSHVSIECELNNEQTLGDICVNSGSVPGCLETKSLNAIMECRQTVVDLSRNEERILTRELCELDVNDKITNQLAHEKCLGKVEKCEDEKCGEDINGRHICSGCNAERCGGCCDDSCGGCGDKHCCNHDNERWDSNSIGVGHSRKLSATTGDEEGVRRLCNGPSDDNAGVCEIATSRHRLRTKSESVQEVKRKSLSTQMPRYQPEPRECSVLSCLYHFTSAELLTNNNKFGCEKCAKLKHGNSAADGKKKKTVYANASKHYLVFCPPAVLTLHFKRFEQVGFTSRKVNRHVDFDFLLNLSPFCSALSPVIKEGQKQVLYSLYGVVEHSGRLTGGHYTAYVKVRPNNSQTTANFLNNNIHLAEDFFSHYCDQILPSTDDAGCNKHAEKDTQVPPGRWYHISDNHVSEVAEVMVRRAQAYMLFYERIV